MLSLDDKGRGQGQKRMDFEAENGRHDYAHGDQQNDEQHWPLHHGIIPYFSCYKGLSELPAYCLDNSAQARGGGFNQRFSRAHRLFQRHRLVADAQ